MKLPFLHENKPTGEIYCGILLKESQGVCYVYEKKTSSVVLLKQKEFQYSDGWEHVVDDIDEALSLIEQEMGKQTIISQCIFFVFAHLIDQTTHEIAKPYIAKLRDISKLLELKPVGYMEVIDAVAEELEKEKQTQLSSIVVELDDTQITVFLFKGGHKIVVQHASRTDYFTEDMQATLEKIAQSHILPNHIYLYDSTDLAEESSDLLLYSWKKNLFIQQPRIAVVQSSTVGKALLNLLEKQLCQKPEILEPKDEEMQPKEVMGFTIAGEDTYEETETNIIESAQEKKSRFVFPKISLSLPPLIRIIPFILVPLVLLGICFGLLYFLHKATITVTVPVEKRNSQVTIQASKKPTKLEQVELQSFTTPFSASEKKDTTGKRDIGEKASGDVTLYSYEEKDLQLSKGTKLQVDSLSFDTNDTITIPASHFAADGITKNPGKAKVAVTSQILGTESNLEKNKRFSISGTSASIVFGINEAAFSGGSKKTVRTISKSDVDAVKTLSEEKAKKAAIDKQKSDMAFLLLPELATVQATKEQFSGEVGETADSLQYTASGDITLYRIPRKTIEDFVAKKLESEKPQGFKTDSVNFTVKDQKKLASGDIQLVIGGEIVFSKSLNESMILTTVVGKSVQEGKGIIQSQFGISQVAVSIVPSVPFIKDRLPFWQNHIRVELIR